MKSVLRAEIFLKICDCSSKNVEIRSKMAIGGGVKCGKSRAKAVFCGFPGAVFHRETLGVSCVKQTVDQIEMGEFWGVKRGLDGACLMDIDSVISVKRTIKENMNESIKDKIRALLK